MTHPWTRVLVCGGRGYGDRPGEKQSLWDTMDALYAKHAIFVIITGGANGADRVAGSWARHKKVALVIEPAKWFSDGRAAGPIRNQRMIDLHKPDVVIAFPGGRGTADMIARATAAGIPVVRIGDTT